MLFDNDSRFAKAAVTLDCDPVNGQQQGSAGSQSKQAVHIQSLIQENSKLNTKLLPEVTEKKAWWMFW
ncbi:MAG TPA: hypothetical protein VGK06_10080 [Methanosarcina sp.]